VRAVYVLVAILSFATPQVSWGAIEHSLSSSGAIVLSSPTAGAAQLSRVQAKPDKTFGCCGAIATDIRPLLPPQDSVGGHCGGSVDLPNLDLDSTPLAPRPPPL
jgi:hypothetical protein